MTAGMYVGRRNIKHRQGIAAKAKVKNWQKMQNRLYDYEVIREMVKVGEAEYKGIMVVAPA